MSADEPKRLVLIDLSAIFRPIWASIPETDDANEAHRITTNKVRWIASKYTHAAIAVDSRKNWRSELYKDYKSNRPPPADHMWIQHARVVETLRDEGFAAWQCDGYEADDVIATAVRMCPLHVDSIDIATQDKDLYQLLGENVWILLMRPGTDPVRIDRKGCVEKFGVVPEDLGDYLALIGDTSDHVPGIPGIGKVTAVRLLKDFGALEGVIDAADDQHNKLTPALRTRIKENAEQARLSRVLVSLKTDAPIDIKEAFADRLYRTRNTAADEGPPPEGDMQDNQPASGPAPAPQPEPKGEPAQQTEERTVPGPNGTEVKEQVKVEPQQKTAQPDGDDPAIARLMNFDPGSDAWAAQLEPRSQSGAWWLAVKLFDSKLFGYKNAAQAFVAIQMGRARGIGAVPFCTNSHLLEVNGREKISMHADMIEGLVLKNPLCKRFRLLESTGKVARYVAQRVGEEPQEWEYTYEKAKLAGLTEHTRNGSPTNWHKRPDAMLRARCKTELARLVFPDVVAGLYSPEELADMEEDIPERLRAA